MVKFGFFTFKYSCGKCLSEAKSYSNNSCQLRQITDFTLLIEITAGVFCKKSFVCINKKYFLCPLFN